MAGLWWVNWWVVLTKSETYRKACGTHEFHVLVKVEGVLLWWRCATSRCHAWCVTLERAVNTLLHLELHNVIWNVSPFTSSHQVEISSPRQNSHTSRLDI